ncbi:MAG TPA: amidophosphoribosyltransferase [Thermoanaerobaculia bacterium]|jgi:amidophosphoribosyltransferase|nr:amidophosphoribosyltransferase [Thermoanaerobaculia bacterium]
MCGIFAIDAREDAANFVYLGLYALQHRGQESAGIVSWDGSRMHVERGMGEVADIFKQPVLQRLPGRAAIGHTRYSTAGSSVLANAQPIVVNTSLGPLGIVHNGNLVNAVEIRQRLEREGAIFQTTSDTEVILHLMAHHPGGSGVSSIVEALMSALEQVRGAYSLLIIGRDTVIAVRDPWGFRPLLLGDALGSDGKPGSPCFASEGCAFDLIGATTVRELEPGEVVVAHGGRIESYHLPQTPEPSRCVFEHVYFARPDSVVFGDAVSEVRRRLGAQLAREAPAVADLVCPVPDSGVFAALGYARESGLPFEFGLIRNHYVGRTFIEPRSSIRHFGVKVKLNPVREVIGGKRVVLIDDSIVRGTTSKKIVRMLKDAGATEVHVRISSPPTAWPCRYGIDTPTREELIAANHTVDDIREFIEADSLAYLSLDGMLRSVSGAPESYCTACWTGEYRVPMGGEDARQRLLFPIRAEGGE